MKTVCERSSRASRGGEHAARFPRPTRNANTLRHSVCVAICGRSLLQSDRASVGLARPCIMSCNIPPPRVLGPMAYPASLNYETQNDSISCYHDSLFSHESVGNPKSINYQ